MTEVKIDGRFTFSKPVTLIEFGGELFEARKFKRAGKETGDTPRYGATFLIPLTDTQTVEAVKAKAAEVVKQKWPGRPLSELAFPFKNGDKLYEKKQAALVAEGKPNLEINAFYKGHMVIVARSKYAPILSALEGGKIVEYSGNRRPLLQPRLYSGALVAPSLNLVPYLGVGNNSDGVTAYLDHVIWLGEGKRIMNQKSATEVFRGFQGHATTENPTGSALDDEIPF